ncbi:hypothetical protein C2G38_649728 [Gigaspora rosea]|uniref:Uncharacterized protein n=1 Tax=Gigaspora rosea TaxID=44941 RepID=A0A397W7P6_9GLOM|nr:hypothetical protein C2G38_649728 [Gigaspora rosea]
MQTSLNARYRLVPTSCIYGELTVVLSTLLFCIVFYNISQSKVCFFFTCNTLHISLALLAYPLYVSCILCSISTYIFLCCNWGFVV